MRKEPVVRVLVADIVIDPVVNVRVRLDEGLVAEYMENFDELPPVVAFKTDKGLVLADGFHRYAAARRLKKARMPAEVRRGTYAEALEYAAVANIRHGKRLESQDRASAVARLKALYPKWKAPQIGKTIGLSAQIVEDILVANSVRHVVPESSALPQAQLVAISRLPTGQWAEVVAAAKHHQWSKREMIAVVRILKNPAYDAEYKRDLLNGQAELVVMRGKDPTILPDTIARKLFDARENNPRLPLWKLMEAVATMRARWQPEKVTENMRRKDIEHLLRELPEDIRYVEGILDAAGKEMGPRRVGVS